MSTQAKQDDLGDNRGDLSGGTAGLVTRVGNY
jgi:hypothetical protein